MSAQLRETATLARHDAVVRDKAPNRRVVIARVVEQEAGVIPPLPGEVQSRLGDVQAVAPVAPGRVVLSADQCTAAAGGVRHTAQVVA
jgi:hypothetical protein